MSEPAVFGEEKIASLVSLLRELDGAVLAFSGGVDSSLLLKVMSLTASRVLAVTAQSETMPESDLEDAVSLAKETGVEHLIIKTDELGREEFASNPPERCFFCKDELFGRLREIARERGLGFVLDGSNADDLLDYRPGRKAAGIHHVRSPLAECGLSKKEIREVSRELGIKTWDRPSSPCLSSRFPYGMRITSAGLARVARAEEFLRGFGIRELRVRDHGDTARIEVGEEDMSVILVKENRAKIADTLAALGYRFVSLDLGGYRPGSMNRMLAPRVEKG